MKPLLEMTDLEIRTALTDCRITLESIYPYRSKDTVKRQSELRAELNRRELMAKAHNTH